MRRSQPPSSKGVLEVDWPFFGELCRALALRVAREYEPEIVLGIAKAYTTRVGAGPFPTELADATGERLGQRGHEFGTVTGRKRRCGWFDACLLRQTVKTAGINGIALTKLDVLDGFETLQVCVAYELDGERIGRLPAGHNAQARLKPVYQSFEGWTQSTRGARSVE